MNLKPDLQLSIATAQAIVDRAFFERAVAKVSKLHGGYEIAFVDPAQASLVLKVYPDELHWKMQKELTVLGLIKDRLSVSVPCILFADDSKKLLGLNFTLMTKLDGSALGKMETVWPLRNGFPLTHKSASYCGSFIAFQWKRLAISDQRASGRRTRRTGST